jgi:hypothetical protein
MEQDDTEGSGEELSLQAVLAMLESLASPLQPDVESQSP